MSAAIDALQGSSVDSLTLQRDHGSGCGAAYEAVHTALRDDMMTKVLSVKWAARAARDVYLARDRRTALGPSNVYAREADRLIEELGRVR